MRAARKQFYYIRKKLAERQVRKKLKTRFYKTDFNRFNTCRTQKPTGQIKSELKALQQYWD